MASTREVARILQEAGFRTLLQEGAREKIFTEAVGDHWLVSLIFGKHTALGLVKVLCNRATMDLQQVLVNAMERQSHRPRLKDAGLLTYRWEESRSGPPRKYYKLTTVGDKFLNELDQTWEELSQAVKKTTRKNAQR